MNEHLTPDEELARLHIHKQSLEQQLIGGSCEDYEETAFEIFSVEEEIDQLLT